MRLSRLVLVLVFFVAPLHADETTATWRRLPSIPDREGFAGPFAGVSHGALLFGGGANFPDKKPWENGTKVWYDTVWALDKPDGKWAPVGKLPRPLGYGVAVTWRDGVVCVGGSDADKHYADAFRLELKDGKLATTSLPSLPQPIANTCGVIVGETLYVAGGLAKPDAQTTLRICYAIGLVAADAKWREIEPWPGSARMLACAGTFDGEFYLFGGVDLSPDSNGDGKPERKYLTDAYRFHPAIGWRRIADLPRGSTASPSPAPTTHLGPLLLGGDDGSQMNKPLEKFDPFPNRLMQYDVKTDAWRDVALIPSPVVAVPVVEWHDMWIVPNGERLPGIRSPHVWGLTLGEASR